MKVTHNKPTNTYNLEGLTEGKLLFLQRVLHEKFVTDGGGLSQDLYLAVERGIQSLPNLSKW